MAVAGTGGELAICTLFTIPIAHPQDKFNKTNPWKICNQNLGSVYSYLKYRFWLFKVNCMAVGDLRGNGKNSLIVITGEGVCFVFDVEYDQEAYEQSPEPTPVRKFKMFHLIQFSRSSLLATAYVAMSLLFLGAHRRSVEMLLLGGQIHLSWTHGIPNPY